MCLIIQDTHRRHLGFISNCHFRWKVCLKLIGETILRPSLSPDRSFNTIHVADYRFYQNDVSHLFLIKKNSHQFASTVMDMRQNAEG